MNEEWMERAWGNEIEFGVSLARKGKRKNGKLMEWCNQEKDALIVRRRS